MASNRDVVLPSSIGRSDAVDGVASCGCVFVAVFWLERGGIARGCMGRSPGFFRDVISDFCPVIVDRTDSAFCNRAPMVAVDSLLRRENIRLSHEKSS